MTRWLPRALAIGIPLGFIAVSRRARKRRQSSDFGSGIPGTVETPAQPGTAR